MYKNQSHPRSWIRYLKAFFLDWGLIANLIRIGIVLFFVVIFFFIKRRKKAKKKRSGREENFKNCGNFLVRSVLKKVIHFIFRNINFY